jgi:phage baseplate assembly protein gpV
MKKLLYILLLGISLAFVQSCSDDGYPVPPASTVPKFTFTIDNDELAPATVTFTNTSIIPDRAGEVSYYWSFGDGTSSTQTSPSHLYEEHGEFIVKLVIVTTASLEIKEYTRAIVIKDPNASGVPLYFWAGSLRSTLINNTAPIVSTLATPGVTSSYGMVVDTVNSKVYLGDDGGGKIWVANLDGSDFKEFRTGAGGINGLAIDYRDKLIYWGTSDGDVRRADLMSTTLTQVETVVTGQTAEPTGIAIDPVTRKLFWNNYNGGLWSKNLDVVGGEVKIIDNPDGGGSVIVVGNKIYYDEFTSGDIKIRSANLDGTNLQTVVTGITRLIFSGIVYNPEDEKLYWGDRNASIIRRANLDGSGQQDYYVTTGGYPRAFALGKPK